jgi:hypothetical protein
MHNGVPIVFQPGQKKYYPQNIAVCLAPDSNLQRMAGSGVPTSYALGITGHHAFPTDPLDGPIASQDPLEALDRSDDFVLTQTEPKALTSEGAESLGIGKSETRVTPLPGETREKRKVQAKQFVNEKVQRGPQYGGDYTGRIDTAKKG